MRSDYGSDHGQVPAAEINIIPLADVLLVLLIIFMVTAPTVTRTIGMDLPRPGPDPKPATLEPLVLRIDAAGDVYRDGALLPLPQLEPLLRAAALAPGPEARRVLIDASDQADYQSVAQVLASAGRAGVQRIAFAAE
jgi:biopolymer transport protein ExbD